MSEITRVALDAMGGDNAPREIVKGAVAFVEQLRRYVRYRLHGSGNVYSHGMLFVHSAEHASQDGSS